MGSRFGKKIEDWIGEACFGCLENTYIPKALQKQVSKLFKRNRTQSTPKPTPLKVTTRPLKNKGLLGIGLFIFGAALIPFRLLAQELAPNQKWIEQADAGFVFPVSTNVSSVFNVGLGGDILVGYRFDRNFSLSTDLGYYDCDQKGPSGAAAGEWIYVPLMEVARYNFGSGRIRPYVLLGTGVAFNNYHETLINLGQSLDLSRVGTDFLLSPGAGVLFVVYSDAAVYLQARMDMNFTPNRSLSSPVVDNPSIFIPVKAGLSFFVL